MPTIRTEFLKISKREPNLGSYIIFARVIKYRKLARRNIIKWFDRLVDKDDYAQNEKRELIDHLETLTNMPKMGIKQD